MSPLTQGRGLKQALRMQKKSTAPKSPLTQGRGLKLTMSRYNPKKIKVAPHTGAWIETNCCLGLYPLDLVAPHTGAWIETLGLVPAKSQQRSRPSHRGVD